MSNFFDTIIIGGGAAGLMCASKIKNQKVLVLEKNKVIGRKIRISGGGKCNFTNLNVSADDYHCKNIHFVKSALSQYSSFEFIDLIKKYDVPFFEKKLGQLFCKKSAADIIKVLENECKDNNVVIKTNTEVTEISKSDNFQIQTKDRTFRSKNLVIATGGLSLKEIGATDFGHIVAKNFGHKLTKTSPALVPFTGNIFKSISGVSLPVRITLKNKKVINDDLLFTHKGLSGPAILKTSLFWNTGETIQIDFLPKENILEILNIYKRSKKKKHLKNFLQEVFPQKMSAVFLEKFFDFKDFDISNLSKKNLFKLNETIHNFSYLPSGTEGYRKAEVTKGGVCTQSISSKTLESKIIPSLYFIGEVLDVTGNLGGYNFQWCWASANAASIAISN